MSTWEDSSYVFCVKILHFRTRNQTGGLMCEKPTRVNDLAPQYEIFIFAPIQSLLTFVRGVALKIYDFLSSVRRQIRVEVLEWFSSWSCCTFESGGVLTKFTVISCISWSQSSTIIVSLPSWRWRVIKINYVLIYVTL